MIRGYTLHDLSGHTSYASCRRYDGGVMGAVRPAVVGGQLAAASLPATRGRHAEPVKTVFVPSHSESAAHAGRQPMREIVQLEIIERLAHQV